MVRKSKKVMAKKWKYLSADDPAQWIWSNRTHRTMSEAFRDAEYACAIQTFKSDWKLTIDFLGNMVYGMFLTGMMLLVPVLLIMWLTK